MTPGEVIKRERERLKMTQRQLAEVLGVAQSYIADIERGRRKLAGRHYRNLPDGMREPATAAAIEELTQRAMVIRGYE